MFPSEQSDKVVPIGAVIRLFPEIGRLNLLVILLTLTLSPLHYLPIDQFSIILEVNLIRHQTRW